MPKIGYFYTIPEIDYDECFKKLKGLGFEGVDDFEKDLEDERWE